MITIITHSDKGVLLANKLIELGLKANVLRSPNNYQELWENNKVLIFIGALGICIRSIASQLQDKKIDPAVINIDVNGEYVQSVISGHIGGANQITKDISKMIGALPVITTVSDSSKLWALDLLPQKFNWTIEYNTPLNKMIADFVNKKPTALLLDIRDKGTLYLETECPEYVKVFFKAEDIDENMFDLILVVSPYIYGFKKQTIYYRPKAIHLGIGCQKDLPVVDFIDFITEDLIAHKISPLSIASIGTADLKADEKAIIELANKWKIPMLPIDSQILAKYDIPNPSERVKKETGSPSVCEAAAMHLSHNTLLCEKVKGKVKGKYFTYAYAFDTKLERKGWVEIVGAGPGDPELVSVRGKRMLQNADYILYAGSLVPRELTEYAKDGCVVENSAKMDLNAQIEHMKKFYDRGLYIVRLHTGDPCIYGAIQEQMNIMDQLNWNYRITPGISSFQAAAAALKSQFTIPEKVQTIILTRAEGRTPMPEKEELKKLAKSQSTMCLFLSASLADKIQAQLLTEYPADTPVAACYKLTWKEERIFRCQLKDLAQTLHDNNLKMTTMIIVGKAIDNRNGISKLYDKSFTHAFRKGE